MRSRAQGIGGNEDDRAEFDANAAFKAVRSARDEVYRLMVGGPFVRFLRHKLYQDFIEERGRSLNTVHSTAVRPCKMCKMG